MDLVDVLIEDPRWEALNLTALSNRAVIAALNVANIPAKYEICVMGCSDARIRELNTEFREKPTATNVLSWPAFDLTPETAGQIPDDPDNSLGDIAIAYQTCLREAEEKGIAPADHVTHLVLHGCLHLLGYDHETDQDAAIMEALEIKALASMGINTPY